MCVQGRPLSLCEGSPKGACAWWRLGQGARHGITRRREGRPAAGSGRPFCLRGGTCQAPPGRPSFRWRSTCWHLQVLSRIPSNLGAQIHKHIFFFHFQTYPGGCVDCTSFALPTHTATRIREVLTPGTYEPGPARCDRAQGRPAGGPESSTATAFVGRTPGGPAAKAERSGHCQPSTAGCRPPRRPGGGQRPSLESPSGQHCAHLGLRSCEIRHFCCFKPLVRGS